MTLHYSKLALAAFSFGSLVATSGIAEAGHFHGGGGGGFHGSVHVSGGGGGVHYSAGAHFSAHYSRPAFHSYGWGVRGGVHVGYGYYPRYYSPYWYGYYGTEYVGSYYPVQAQAVAAYAPAAFLPRPELPRIGLGVFGGGVSVQTADGNSKPDSSDVGVLGRIRLTPGLILEGELGKTTMDKDLRVDRRLGGSLLYEFGAYNHLAPYVVAGLGVEQADVAGTYSTTQDYAEIGIGLRYALGPHFAIAADLRAGSRASVSNGNNENTLSGTARSIAPPTSDSGNSEDYTRGRVSAIVYF